MRLSRDAAEPVTLAPTPCLESGCRENATYQGRCSPHRKPAYLGSTRKERLPRDWSTRRAIVLKRDNSICYLCGETGADTVDHIVAGDDHALENLAAVHDRVAPHCHRYKTSQDAHAARKGQAIKRRR